MPQNNKASWWNIVKSVAASAFGVQSEKNRQQDFQQTSVLPYIIVGIVFVVLFVLTIMWVVSQAIN